MLPESLDDMVAIAAAKLTLGQLSGEEVHAVAMNALLTGIDCEEVLVLVDMRKPFAFDLEELFIRLIDKLGVKLPNVQEATLRVAREVATRIISGSVTPYDGARHIWWKLANLEGCDQRLNVFVGLASEIEDCISEETRAEYVLDIVREARALLVEDSRSLGAS